MRLCWTFAGSILALSRNSGALLPEPCRLLLCDQPWQSNQVVRRATEDEQPVHFLQPSQLYLAQRAGLLQPTKSLFHQPSAAQADGITRLARGPSIEVAAAPFVVLRYVWSDI